MERSDYNELKHAIGRRDVLRELAAAALADNMHMIVARLVACGVLPPGTRALRPSIVQD
ncbi:MAG: hypothetical protein IVW36_09970 [Dehalococcoidia bacterium]|nr:hypothetical protein [Dehalococcoidia bacterium]